MKIQTSIKIDRNLLELAKAEAKAQNRSFSNYIEHLLSREIVDIPKKVTKTTIVDNHYNLNLSRVHDFDRWIETLLNGESDI